MSIDALLYEEIENEFENLNDLKVGTDQHKTTVEGLTKLMDRAIEIKKIDDEKEEKEKIREFEQSLKLQQIEEDRKDRKFKNGIAIAGIAVPSVLTIWGTLKSLKFEEKGTITTIMGRGFINKLLPKK